MINLPLLIFIKYGYTGLFVGVKKRAAGIDRDMPGLPVPIFFVITIFAYDVEQWVHRQLSPLQARFYKGSGHTETYWVLAIIPALVVMCALWFLNGLIVWGIWRVLAFLWT